MTDQERIALYQTAYKEASLGPGARYAIGGSLGAALGVVLATATARDRKEAIRNSLMFGGLLGAMGGSMGIKTTPPVKPTRKEPPSEKFSRTGPIQRWELSGEQEPIKPEEWKKSKDDSPIKPEEWKKSKDDSPTGIKL
jgi:hypothetical protein